MTRQLLIYDRMVPVSPADHGDLSIQATGRHDVAARLNAIPLLASEFTEAGLDHPVVFLRQGDAVFPVAVTGLRPDRNEHVGHDGRWDDSYLPAFLRRYPFALAQDGHPARDSLALCIDETYPGLNRAGRGERLFDSDGNQTGFLRRIIDFAAEFHSQHHRTAAFCARLDALGLLDPAEAEFTYWSGRPGSLSGFSIISRTRLHQLPPDTLAELFGNGSLELVHAHLASLRRLDRLRDAAGQEGGAALTRARAADTPPALSPDAGAMHQALMPLLARPPLVALSRKLSALHRSEDRPLFTFRRSDITAPDARGALAAVLGHPLPPAIADLWDSAQSIHLGLDGADGPRGPVRKLYLEFPPDAAPQDGLVYLAVKVGDDAALHHYERVADPAPLIASLFPQGALRDAAQLLAAASPMVLKVHDPASRRLSVDINLADVSPATALQTALDDILHAIDPAAPRARHWPSHVALGHDRDGTPFATVYGWPDAPAP